MSMTNSDADGRGHNPQVQAALDAWQRVFLQRDWDALTLAPSFIQPGVRFRRFFCPDGQGMRRASARSHPSSAAPEPVAV